MEFKIQPHTTEIEESVLGCILEKPEEFHRVEPYLAEKGVWYLDSHKRLWEILSRMSANNEHIDIVTVISNLTDNDLKMGLDKYWITGLKDNSYAPSKSIVYAKKMYEDFLYRQTIIKTEQIQKKAYAGNSSVYPLIGETYTVLGELLDMRPSEGFDMGESLDKAIEEITEGGGNMIKSGWSNIDKFGGGFTRGEISIVGGRPGHGKTTFLVNLAANLVQNGYKVMLFNRELPITEVVKKFICLESGKLSYRMVRNSDFSASDIEELARVDKRLRKLYASNKFQMFDKIRDFDGTALEVRKFAPDIILDDYIQLIQPSKQIMERRLQLERICNDYKWLAKTHNCVVILASQLNRAVEYRGTKTAEPQLSDLAESGAIEQVAENVFFTHYQWKLNQDKKQNSPNKLKLIAGKVRYGETGSIMMGYDGDKCKLYSTYKEYEKQV